MSDLERILAAMLNCNNIYRLTEEEAEASIPKLGFINIIQFLQKMVRINTFLNRFMVNSLIMRMGELGLVENAWLLHNFAVAKKIANVLIYNSTLKVIANSPKRYVLYAIDLLVAAIKAGIADKWTYAYTMCAIVKTAAPDRKKALNLPFQAAKKLDYLDKETCAVIIEAVAKSSEPDETLGLTLFYEALREDYVNRIILNNILDVIAKTPEPNPQINFRIACSILDECTKKFDLPDLRTTQKISVRDLSYGGVYFGLTRRLRESTAASNKEQGPLYVYDANSPVFKLAITRVLKETSHLGVIGVWEDKIVKISHGKNSMFSNQKSPESVTQNLEHIVRFFKP